MKNQIFLLFIIREVAAKFELFKTSCEECSAKHDCQDIAVEIYRNMAPYRGQRHVPQLMEMFFESEHRFFCLKGHSNVDFRFELPIPDLNLATIPTLLAFDGKQELALSVLAVRDRYVEGYKYDTQSSRVPSQVEKFISQLGDFCFTVTARCADRKCFCRRTDRIAGIERSQQSDFTKCWFTSVFKDNLEPAGDSEHTTDFSRFAAIMNFIRDSNSQFEENLTTLQDPNAHPEYYQQAAENDYNVERPSSFNPAILFVMSKDEEPFTVEEFLFILQSEPSLAQDPVIPYLFMKDSDAHDKLRTYLMARLLTPELFQNNGNNMSTALALLQ
ncbi:unnamed protein product [Oikopleura dioica]|uniref:Thioredoxin domain-containing protein n=1 Tax=Oikopleura dioica TaxID=34765 RepID=E4X0C2_OIKDI|nr:unnamed protein product [Oikopleura dioica]